MDYKVLVHFLNHETGAILAPGDGFETKDKDVIKLLVSTGYIEKVTKGESEENVPVRKSKKSLRISHEALDDEIQDTIEACKKKMAISGVFVINEDDPLVIQAVKTYCKAEIGLLTDEKELYQESFQSQVEHLALSGDYNEL